MYSYQKILENSRKYNEFISKKELCEMCGVCPHTATKILKSGKLPYCRKIERLVHFCEISVRDVLAYFKNEQRLLICDNAELKRMKLYYISKFEKAEDILSTPEIGRLTGYGKETARRWIIKGFIPAARCKERFYISKDDLIEFLCSELYAGIIRKSEVHIEDEINIKKLLE